MLTRNDLLILRMQVDVNKACDLLRMFKEAGHSHIDICSLLRASTPKIVGVEEYIKKLKLRMQNRVSCNISEFAIWLDVSRQTVYNWKQYGYLVFSGKKIDLPGTIELWQSIPWLSGK